MVHLHKALERLLLSQLHLQENHIWFLQMEELMILVLMIHHFVITHILLQLDLNLYLGIVQTK